MLYFPKIKINVSDNLSLEAIHLCRTVPLRCLWKSAVENFTELKVRHSKNAMKFMHLIISFRHFKII
jgi:hypothetical protein